jgi:hypothetical protein
MSRPAATRLTLGGAGDKKLPVSLAGAAGEKNGKKPNRRENLIDNATRRGKLSSLVFLVDYPGHSR